jgi:hypothetical protein
MMNIPPKITTMIPPWSDRTLRNDLEVPGEDVAIFSGLQVIQGDYHMETIQRMDNRSFVY